MPKSNLKIYNTLSKKKEPMVPLKNKRVNLFVCGPTVYDFAHIGHARTYVIFDCFVKYLQYLGFNVYYLQNITNVDDKIIVRAKEKGVSPDDLADAFEKEHLKDMKLLNITSVNKYAKATDYIKHIISQVQQLLDKGYAYQLDDGIYFDIAKFKPYGKLSGRTALQAEDAVSRIDYSTHKKNRGDFCLWKHANSAASPEGEAYANAPMRIIDGEPSWPSPFGQGRPGWHIEDTAITETFFGTQYDIHGGGRDLIFPHHEAEIAQMEAISGKRPLVKYWMHTGFLNINDQKMSKSLNNSITIDAFLQRYSAELLRFWIAKNAWHAPVNYSDSVMIEVRSALEKIEEFLRKLKMQKSTLRLRSGREIKMTVQNAKILKNAKIDFYKSLDDNFNTPKAFAVLFELIKHVNMLLDQHAVSKTETKKIYDFFTEINGIFGIIDFKKLKESNIPGEVKALAKEREAYRQAQDWQKADHVRIEIEKYGFAVEDTEKGSVLKKIENRK